MNRAIGSTRDGGPDFDVKAATLEDANMVSGATQRNGGRQATDTTADYRNTKLLEGGRHERLGRIE